MSLNCTIAKSSILRWRTVLVGWILSNKAIVFMYVFSVPILTTIWIYKYISNIFQLFYLEIQLFAVIFPLFWSCFWSCFCRNHPQFRRQTTMPVATYRKIYKQNKTNLKQVNYFNFYEKLRLNRAPTTLFPTDDG